MTQCQIQIGKNGLTPGTIENIKLAFKTHDSVKICLLKSTKHTKPMAKKIAEEIVLNLGPKFTYKVIGFTITVRKWRKPRKPELKPEYLKKLKKIEKGKYIPFENIAELRKIIEK